MYEDKCLNVKSQKTQKLFLADNCGEIKCNIHVHVQPFTQSSTLLLNNYTFDKNKKNVSYLCFLRILSM